MPQVNLFKMIHTAIRGQLASLTTTVGKTDYTNLQKITEIHSSTISIQTFLKAHAEREDTYVLPVLKERKFSELEAFNDEHTHSEQTLENLVLEITDLKDNHATRDQAQQNESGYQFYLNLAMFQAFYLTHMNTEERVIMPFLLQVMSSDEVFNIYMAMQASVSDIEALETISAIFPYIDFALMLKLTRTFKEQCPNQFPAMIVEMRQCLKPDVCQELFDQAGITSGLVNVSSFDKHDDKRAKTEDEADMNVLTQMY